MTQKDLSFYIKFIIFNVKKYSQSMTSKHFKAQSIILNGKIHIQTSTW